MSVRTEPKEISPQMQQALMIPEHVMRSAAAQAQEGAMVAAPADPSMNEQHLAAANDFNTSNPDHPLKRTVVVNIRASLNDLCLKKSKATWSPPSAEATKAIFQQRKFTDLAGNAETQGDLAHSCNPLSAAQTSWSLHKMAISAQRNTFPVALGVRITGVDDSTFSQTGEAYSTISLPSTDLHTSRILQEDDTALAYEFVVANTNHSQNANLTTLLHHHRLASSRATPLTTWQRASPAFEQTQHKPPLTFTFVVHRGHPRGGSQLPDFSHASQSSSLPQRA